MVYREKRGHFVWLSIERAALVELYPRASTPDDNCHSKDSTLCSVFEDSTGPLPSSVACRIASLTPIESIWNCKDLPL
jgi:hypothetical protein